MANYFLVQALVPAPHTHQLDEFLQEIGAREIMFRPYRNGVSAPAAKTGGNRVGRSAKDNRVIGGRQQTWITHTLKDKGEVKIADIKAAWLKAGFSPNFIYGAFERAVKNKVAKKIGPGIYKAVSHG